MGGEWGKIFSSIKTKTNKTGNSFSREKLYKGFTYLKERYNWSINSCFDEDFGKAGTHTHDNDNIH